MANLYKMMKKNQEENNILLFAICRDFVQQANCEILKISYTDFQEEIITTTAG